MAKQQTFTNADVERPKAALVVLPRKPKTAPEHLLMPDLIRPIRVEIRAALQRGYSLHHLVTSLSEKDSISRRQP